MTYVYIPLYICLKSLRKYITTNPLKPLPRFRSNYADIVSTEAGQQKVLSLCQVADTQSGLRCETDACIIRGTAASCERDETIWNTSRMLVPKSKHCESGRYCIMEQVKE